MTGRREVLRTGVLMMAAALPWRAGAAAGARVVVAGGGFAGAGCALALRRLAPQIEVTVVDPNDHYSTCPMSNAVLAQLRSLQSITLDRTGLVRAGARYVRESVTDIDPQKRSVRLGNHTALPYDRLVIAPGIRLLYGQPEGYDEAAAAHLPHAWEAGPATARLARQLQAVPDGGTVAISVPAGLMRCPPGPYERASLFAFWLQAHRRRCKILIFDSNNHFPRQDVFSAAWSELYPGMIEWIPPTEGGVVTRIVVATRTLYSSSGAHRVSLANIIPPQAPGALAQLHDLSSGHGWCPVNAGTFESVSVPGVHVIGDACIAGAMPKAASAAHSQALQCAAAVAASLTGRPPPPIQLKSVCYSQLSSHTALAIHANFAVIGDHIESVAATTETQDTGATAAHLAEAQTWYDDIRSACFGT